MSWSLDSYNLSASSIMFSDVQCRGYAEDVDVGTGCPMVSSVLCVFDQLRLSRRSP